MILKYTKKHNLQKLNNELMELEFLQPIKGEKEEDGVTFVAFIKSDGDTIELRIERDLTQEQISMINNVISNHNPIIVTEPSVEERLKATEDALLMLMNMKLMGGM